MSNVGVFQDIGLRGVTDRSMKTKLLGAADSIAIQIDDGYSALAINERLCGDLASRSETDDDHVRAAR